METLSDKKHTVQTSNVWNEGTILYHESDVKESIRKLKGNFSLRGTQLGGQEKKAMVSMETINKIIDETFGDKLT